MGNTCSPQKILPAVIAKRTAAVIPVRRVHVANVFGRLVIRSDADHNAMPAPKDGTLAVRPAAVFDSNRLSPATNTRKPAATQSFPILKYFMVNKAVATTRPTASMAQNACRSDGCPMKVPARPNTPPIARPTAATRSRRVGVDVFTRHPRWKARDRFSRLPRVHPELSIYLFWHDRAGLRPPDVPAAFGRRQDHTLALPLNEVLRGSETELRILLVVAGVGQVVRVAEPD